MSIAELDVKSSIPFFDLINEEHLCNQLVSIHPSNKIFIGENFLTQQECDKIIYVSEEQKFIKLPYRCEGSERLITLDSTENLRY